MMDWQEMRQLNADGDLLLAGSNVIRFPGRLLVRPPRLGPFNQPIEKAGELVRLGGTDATAHATVQDCDGATWSFDVSRELAVRLSPYLYVGRIRLVGTARWVRNDEGVWEHTSLRASDFVALRDESLADAVIRIRGKAIGAWSDDPLGLVRSLRDDDSELH